MIDHASGAGEQRDWIGVRTAHRPAFLGDFAERLITSPTWTQEDRAAHIPSHALSYDATPLDARSALS